MTKMIIVCMCCNKVLGYKDDEGSGCDKTSGICDPCLYEHYPEQAEEVIRQREEEREAA